MRAMDLHTVEPGLARHAGAKRKTFDHLADVMAVHCDRRAELAAGQVQRDGGRGMRGRIDQLRRLAPGMADLHPHLPAAFLTRRRPGLQGRHVIGIGPAIDRDIAGRFQVAAIDQHIPRQKHAAAALAPRPVKPGMTLARAIADGDLFGHRRLAQAVGKLRPARQVKRLLKNAGHGQVALPDLSVPEPWPGAPEPSRVAFSRSAP